jgi:outer membrane lipoprotein-sorting protein/peroxiredoxin
MISSLMLLLAVAVPQSTDGQALYDQISAKLTAAKGLSVDAEISLAGQIIKTSAKALKPNFYNMVADQQEAHCDGKNAYIYVPSQKQYFKMPVTGNELQQVGFPGMESFVAPEPIKMTVKSMETKTFNGVETNMLALEGQINGRERKYAMYVAKDTGLPVGIEDNSVQGFQLKITYRNLVLDPPDLTPDAFKWAPPADAKEAVQETGELNPALLKVGATAPKFSVKLASGGTTSLAALLPKSKAVLVTFWFSECEDFPQMQKLYSEYKAKGLAIVAVNYQDSADAIKKYAKTVKATFPLAMNGIGTGDAVKLYGVKAFPTSYLVNSKGKIVWASIAYDDAGLRKALKGLIAATTGKKPAPKKPAKKKSG